MNTQTSSVGSKKISTKMWIFIVAVLTIIGSSIVWNFKGDDIRDARFERQLRAKKVSLFEQAKLRWRYDAEPALTAVAQRHIDEAERSSVPVVRIPQGYTRVNHEELVNFRGKNCVELILRPLRPFEIPDLGYKEFLQPGVPVINFIEQIGDSTLVLPAPNASNTLALDSTNALQSMIWRTYDPKYIFRPLLPDDEETTFVHVRIALADNAVTLVRYVKQNGVKQFTGYIPHGPGWYAKYADFERDRLERHMAHIDTNRVTVVHLPNGYEERPPAYPYETNDELRIEMVLIRKISTPATFAHRMLLSTNGAREILIVQHRIDDSEFKAPFPEANKNNTVNIPIGRSLSAAYRDTNGAPQLQTRPQLETDESRLYARVSFSPRSGQLNLETYYKQQTGKMGQPITTSLEAFSVAVRDSAKSGGLRPQ